ncbi:segregation/condensation protein A [Erysipelotrichaceae bacterium RD49]|nr:segregation/condensation protein A [Erysipelotrichaceae bacterium RD49]
MEFNVSLDQFEGPLDLMLHLVHTHKLDLFELKLDVLASQYIAYIRQALAKGLDVSSEYLVEFTALMEYKSRKLLPKKQEVEVEDTYEEDPALTMARRLQEYEKCKQEAALLAKLHEARQSQIDRAPASLIDQWAAREDLTIKLHLKSADLQKAFERVMRRYAILKPYQTQVEVKELSVEERMAQILAMDFKKQAPFQFEDLLADVQTMHEVVVTFLAVLELVHDGQAVVHCNEQEEIWIQLL